MNPHMNVENEPFHYISSPDLDAAVSMAVELGWPLLVTGEPGTGKTLLAYYIAQKEKLNPPLRFNTKTTSKATDLFYRYNALPHFRDAQTGRTDLNPMNYVQIEPLGRAIIDSNFPDNKRYVILIDEIDKAPRDFPNDVLFEFEQMAFRISEAKQKEVEAWAAEEKVSEALEEGTFRFKGPKKQKPIVILTSNSEKNLPDAFLRRCAYYHIPFPDEQKLMEIVEANVSFTEAFTHRMLEDAVAHFVAIRKQYHLRKPPATAELMAWIEVLAKHGIDVKKGMKGTDEHIREKLKQTYFLLTKNREDQERVIDALMNHGV